ncbi:MAG: hypothetical protein POELPBGB_01448 [Bacteroidia bacterium]|nr:hypothetical protein [Bacteroidia bacterium]
MKAYIIISYVDTGLSKHIEGMFLNKATAVKSLKNLVAETDKDLEARHLISHKGRFKKVRKAKKSNFVISYANNYNTVKLIPFELNKCYDKIIDSCKPDDFDSLFYDKKSSKD